MEKSSFSNTQGHIVWILKPFLLLSLETGSLTGGKLPRFCLSLMPILSLVRLQAYALHLPFYVILVMQTQVLVLKRPALAPP